MQSDHIYESHRTPYVQSPTYLLLPTLLTRRLLRLPRKSNFVRRILRPPKLDSHLASQLSVVYNHGAEDDDKGESGVLHEEVKRVADMRLPCLAPDEAHNDGEELEMNAVENPGTGVDSGSSGDVCCRGIFDLVYSRCWRRGAGVQSAQSGEAPVIVASDDCELRIARRSRRHRRRQARIGSGLGHLGVC